ncbi:hypothetical protein KU75_22920 [Pectobacterium odoriferum]|uniref:Uncharacterized protein n=1 Tax=Pectobacterium odoriferum TaxID=78398 RepID=A0ABR4VJ69_9GAMM|nr:hypothetical protein [Pectobacterium odoriferum]KGA39409.1 hypothetical protein KU75_22920 [Pectobacterium odoriferum]
MNTDDFDEIENLQIRVGAIEYMVRMLAAAHGEQVIESIEKATLAEIEKWDKPGDKEKNIVAELMKQSLSLIKAK